MSDTAKIRRWMSLIGEEMTTGANLWTDAVDSMAKGTYEPKKAFKDWSELYARAVLCWIPDPPKAAGQFGPVVRLNIHEGQKTATGSAAISPPASSATLTLVEVAKETADPTKTIPKNRFELKVFDGNSEVRATVTLQGTDVLAQDEVYEAVIQSGTGPNTTPVARLRLEVEAPLPPN